MRCAWPEIKTIEDREGRKDVSHNWLHSTASCLREMSCNYQLLGRTLRSSVFRSDEGSSCDFPSNAKPFKPHTKIQLFTDAQEWVIAFSVNIFFHLSCDKLQKNPPKRSPTVQIRARVITGLDRSTNLGRLCCCLSSIIPRVSTEPCYVKIVPRVSTEPCYVRIVPRVSTEPCYVRIVLNAKERLWK